jgi:hypothetical protein
MGRPGDDRDQQHHAAARPVYANEGICQFLFLKGESAARGQLRRPQGQIHGPARRRAAEALGSHRWTASASAAAAAARHHPDQRREERDAAADGGRLLSDGPLTLTNAPDLADIATMRALLAQHGLTWSTTRRRGPSPSRARRPTSRRPTTSCARCAPRCWCSARCWRASARRGLAARRLRHRHAPGRPAPQGARADGRQIELDRGYIEATAPEGRAAGRAIIFPQVSVGATENLLMAAVLAEGHHRAGQRRARARDRRPRHVPDAHGRADRGHRHRRS